MSSESNKDSSSREQRPLSPCILICTLDENQVCLGCGRKLEQISRWALMSRDEQWAVVDELAARETDV
jgi:hypothetical protein